jgi:hypothetical protein
MAAPFDFFILKKFYFHATFAKYRLLYIKEITWL